MEDALDTHEMTFKLRIWLESDEGFRLGPGKVELLRRIDEYGSLNKAAKSLGMSYRKAWGRVKDAEANLGEPLVFKSGGNKKGYSLTPFATELIDSYAKWIDAVHQFARQSAPEMLPETVSLTRS